VSSHSRRISLAGVSEKPPIIPTVEGETKTEESFDGSTDGTVGVIGTSVVGSSKEGELICRDEAGLSGTVTSGDGVRALKWSKPITGCVLIFLYRDQNAFNIGVKSVWSTHQASEKPNVPILATSAR